ncbi:MAG: polymerase delta prime subunit [Pseudomonadota bacterium]|jgi:DNA polymerase-3 subunit delta'
MSTVAGSAERASPALADLFWLAPQREQLREARAHGRLPAALLIRDLPGGGGGALALIAAQAALCREPGAPCGRCATCVKVEEGRHPDLWRVSPEGDSKQIRVDQVRELAETLALTGYSSSSAVAILDPAEALNANAANALLKTLEEPRAGVLLVLVASLASRLPATIISRCQRLTVRPPARQECLAWLRRHGDGRDGNQGASQGDWEGVLDVLGLAPLQALAVSPVELGELLRETHDMLERALAGRLDCASAAERWARQSYELRMACAENWVTERLLVRLGVAGNATEARPLPKPGMLDFAPSASGLVRWADALRDLSNLAQTGVNRALAVEQLLWQLVALGST